jgi:hypothetical protein
MPVVSKGQYVVGRYTTSGEIHMNTATESNAANNVGETVHSMNISSAMWSCSNGAYFNVSRGANLVATYALSGSHDYQSGNIIDNLPGEASSNVVVTKVGLGDVFLTLKLHKKVS